MLSINSAQLVFGEKTKSSKKREAATPNQGFWINSTGVDSSDKVVLTTQITSKKKPRTWQKVPKGLENQQTQKARELAKNMPLLKAFGLLEGIHY